MSLESARIVCPGADPKRQLFVNRIYPMNHPCIQEQTFRLIKLEQKNTPGRILSDITPTLQKPEGFRVKATEGEVVVLYFEPSATQNLKSSGFPCG